MDLVHSRITEKLSFDSPPKVGHTLYKSKNISKSICMSKSCASEIVCRAKVQVVTDVKKRPECSHCMCKIEIKTLS